MNYFPTLHIYCSIYNIYSKIDHFLRVKLFTFLPKSFREDASEVRSRGGDSFPQIYPSGIAAKIRRLLGVLLRRLLDLAPSINNLLEPRALSPQGPHADFRKSAGRKIHYQSCVTIVWKKIIYSWKRRVSPTIALVPRKAIRDLWFWPFWIVSA